MRWLGMLRRRFGLSTRLLGTGGGTPTPTHAIVVDVDPIDVDEDAAVGTALTGLSVSNGVGSYSWSLIDGGAPSSSATTLTDNGDSTATLKVGSLNYETHPSITAVVQADNGIHSPLLKSIPVAVNDVVETPAVNIAPLLLAMGMI
jgi:hypothetical protein